MVLEEFPPPLILYGVNLVNGHIEPQSSSYARIAAEAGRVWA